MPSAAVVNAQTLSSVIAVLPIVGGLLVVTVASNIAQVIFKKLFGRKLLRVAPLHHHFQMKGYPEPKIVMRFMIVGILLAVIIIAVS